MKIFKLFKENRLDKEYLLNETEITGKFIDWLETKEEEWLDYYAIDLVRIFISEPSGLNSVTDEYNEILELLNDDVKWNHLNSLGIY